MRSKRLKIAVAVSVGVVLLAAITVLLIYYVNAHYPGRSTGVSGLRVAVERVAYTGSSPKFKFSHIPGPFQPNAATTARFSIVSGGRDNNSNGQFQDGVSPDGPEQSFFFSDGSIGGRLLVDLKQPMDLIQINTYSRHPLDRAPQRYDLYAHADIFDGTSPSAVGRDNPLNYGWVLLAKIDTRPKFGPFGGQYGVSISDPRGSIGHYRYLMFECRRNESTDRWGNTCYSEIDVVAK